MTTQQQNTTAESAVHTRREAGLQKAATIQWHGWNWKKYQVAITRQNQAIAQTAAERDRLREQIAQSADWQKLSIRFKSQLDLAREQVKTLEQRVKELEAKGGQSK